MTKDSQPKAINIVRPGTFMGTKRLGSSSVHSGSVHSGSVVSTSSTASSRKPRVTNKIESNKPTINLYHPPSRKPSEDGRSMTGRTLYNNNKPNSIPTLNHQQQQQQQPYYLQQQHYNQQQPQLQPQRMTKSFTAPSLQTPHEPSRSVSPSSNIIRPHRSVLSPITATSSNIHAEPEETSYSSSSEQEEEEEEEEEEDEEEEEEEISDDGSQVSTDDDDDDGNEPRNTARVNRQIEDLEISNQSLLTVNAMLESTVRKQASELAQFKRLMASGQLPQQDLIIPVPPPMTANEDDDESSDDWEKDETFQRLRKVTEMMIKQGQKAVDFEYKILGRVLADYQLEEEEEDEQVEK